MKGFNNSLVFRPFEGLFFFLVAAVTVGLLTSSYYMYAILPGILILIFFILAQKPHIGYYIILFLIPFGEYRAFMESYQFLTISKILGFWIVVVLIFHALFNRLKHHDIKSTLWPWLVVFVMISLFSILMSMYPYTSLENMRKLLVAVMIFMLTLIFVSVKSFTTTLPIIIISSTAITSFLAVIGYIFNIPYFTINIESLKRASGLLDNPNHFAFLILFSLPLLFHYISSSTKVSVKIIAFALFFLNITAIILSFSRGAAIVLAVLLFILIIENIRRLRPRYIGFIGLSLVLVIVTTSLVIPFSYWERQKSTFTDTSSDEAIKRRISYLYVARDAFKENPIVGSGIGTFKDIYADSGYGREYMVAGVVPERFAHNTYIEVLTGTGVIGLAVFIIIILVTLRNYYKAQNLCIKQGRKDLASLAAAYRLSFISLIIYYFMLSSAYHKYFWLSLGLSQVVLRFSQNNQEPANSE